MTDLADWLAGIGLAKYADTFSEQEIDFELLPLLTEADVRLSMLSAIAFGRGPGAFTGVRLAASVTQGLAFGAGLKVVPVSDLQALAQRVLDDAPGIGRVLVCNDARMQELYWGCFERTAGGFARASGEEHVSGPGEIRLPAPAAVPPTVLP